MSAAAKGTRAEPPVLSLATARIVHRSGDYAHVFDSDLTARVLSLHRDNPAHLFIPENIAREIDGIVALLRHLADVLAAEDRDNDESRALHFLAESLTFISHRLDVMGLTGANNWDTFKIEPKTT